MLVLTLGTDRQTNQWRQRCGGRQQVNGGDFVTRWASQFKSSVIETTGHKSSCKKFCTVKIKVTVNVVQLTRVVKARSCQRMCVDRDSPLYIYIPAVMLCCHGYILVLLFFYAVPNVIPLFIGNLHRKVMQLILWTTHGDSYRVGQTLQCWQICCAEFADGTTIYISVHRWSKCGIVPCLRAQPGVRNTHHNDCRITKR